MNADEILDLIDGYWPGLPDFAGRFQIKDFADEWAKRSDRLTIEDVQRVFSEQSRIDTPLWKLIPCLHERLLDAYNASAAKASMAYRPPERDDTEPAFDGLTIPQYVRSIASGERPVREGTVLEDFATAVRIADLETREPGLGDVMLASVAREDKDRDRQRAEEARQRMNRISRRSAESQAGGSA